MADVRAMPPRSLADLVTLAKQRHQVESGRELARTSERLDIPISYTVLNQIERGTYRHRLERGLRANLARLAGVSDDLVARLAGLPITAPFDLPESADYLTGDQRQAVLQVVRAFVRANESGGEIEEAAMTSSEPAGPPEDS